jgi:hypothetical protein
MQKTIRINVEWCFGVLQIHFTIIQNPSTQWDMVTIKNIIIGLWFCTIQSYKMNPIYNIQPLFDIRTNGSHLKWGFFFKIIAKKPLRLKMQLFIIILKMTLWNIFRLERATISIEINILFFQYQIFRKTFLIVMKFVD